MLSTRKLGVFRALQENQTFLEFVMSRPQG
jgi:hypothetical protein